MPDVTVLMAVYNGEAYLRPAIDSVLAQTWRDFDFIIVNDGSTDRSDEICRSYTDARVRVITLQTNRGLSTALNAGLAATQTALVARLDQDDIAEPQRLARQREVMLARPELALLGSQAVAIAPDGAETGTVRRPLESASIQWSSLFENPFAHTTVMFRTAVVRDELGGFRSSYDPFAQDYELWSRVMLHHPVANLADRLVRHRVHRSSIMGGATPAGSFSEGFAAMERAVISAHARRLFDERLLPDADLRLIPGLVLGLDRADVGAFLDRFERLLAAFSRRHSGTSSADFAFTLARQFDALALRVTPHSRRAAARIYAHALRRHPHIGRHLSWTRAATLLLFGKRGRDRVGAWARRYLAGAVD
jgi:glycosyltransferase involved in cell wall biosynthesis